ncbi:MAG: hypothetical protein H0U27_11555 [Nitrosopumilus sp.]|nr:hypothetical protein [Nitrosopumilus sp.]
MNSKINYLSFLLLNCKQKKILFIDFDTTFSSYFQNTVTLAYDKIDYSDFMIVLPGIKNMDFFIKEMVDSLSCNSILILDSLNGLIDALNMLNLYKMKNKKLTEGAKSSRQKSGGYQSLNILSLLLKKTENKKIPIVITVYQSLERSKKMVNELLMNNDELETNNHFLRISSNVLFLEFDEGGDRTGLTLLKKNSSVSCSPTSTPLTNHTNIFFPYSRWFY